MVFVTPEVPRWTPTTEADIRRAVDEGLLEESHFWDAKRELGLGKPAANKKHAADLAAFAVDGGSLLIGLAEDKANETFRMTPQPTAGMAERIESIAATAVDPPLYVTVSTIPSERTADDGTPLGYLIIEVPPSARAPHQVDGVYWGRGDKQNIRLSDPDVQRHLKRRAALGATGSRLLDQEVERDPGWMPNQQHVGHLHLIAEPLSAAPESATSLLRSQGAEDWIRRTTVTDDPPEIRAERSIPPSLDFLNRVERRSNGLAHTTPAIAGAGRTWAPLASQYGDPESSLLDIEFRNSGGIRALVGRVTMSARPDGDLYILDRLIVAYARRLVSWIARYGQDIGYRGSWVLGVHADGLGGKCSTAFYDSAQNPSPTLYDEAFYRKVTTASTQEIHGQPVAVTARLVADLVWSLGTADLYRHILES